ncbi:ABC transporter permease [Streptomyces sp. NPDC056716]|uniref:ABC transporter permease n=1 Tax=unclassified Streptomyces TaxID=2593676 RepID=UPI0036B0E6C8
MKTAVTSAVDGRAEAGRATVKRRGRPGRAARLRPAGRPAAPRTGATLLAHRLLCVAAALGLWQAVVALGVAPPSALAAPSAVFPELVAVFPTAEFWADIGDTLRSWVTGLAISLAVAVPVGLALGASDLAYRMSRFTIDFLRTIPPVSLIPLSLLLYGASERMALILIVFGSVWPVLMQTMYGVHQVDPVARDATRAYRLSRRDVIFALVLPSAAPFIATGIRIAATMSLLLAIGAELIGGAPGIGRAIALALESGDIPRMYAFVVVSAVLGVLLNLAMVTCERRLLGWHPSHRPRVL